MDQAVRTVDVVVKAVIEEFELVHCDDLVPTGDTYSIGKHVEGVNWRDLQVGQRLRCEYVGERATKVLRAQLLD